MSLGAYFFFPKLYLCILFLSKSFLVHTFFFPIFFQCILFFSTFFPPHKMKWSVPQWHACCLSTVLKMKYGTPPPEIPQKVHQPLKSPKSQSFFSFFFFFFSSQIILNVLTQSAQDHLSGVQTLNFGIVRCTLSMVSYADTPMSLIQPNNAAVMNASVMINLLFFVTFFQETFLYFVIALKVQLISH